MALAQFEREPFNYGTVANDKQGDPIRVHAIKAERAEQIVYSWISGGASLVKLPDALPIARGGTGATSVASAIKNFGYFEDTNKTLRRGVKVLTMKSNGITDRFGNMPGATWKKETGIGVYTITRATPDNQLWSFVLPMTPLGLPKVIIELTNVGDIITIKTFAVNLSTATPSKGAAQDLPVGLSIDIEVK